jgi:hypothetical protein
MFSNHDNPKEVVYLLRSSTSPSAVDARENGQPGPMDLYLMLDVLVSQILRHLTTGATVIIVGVEILPSPWMEEFRVNATDPPSQMFLQSCMAKVRFRLSLPHSNPQQTFLRNIKFLDMDEYLASIGPERVALETIEPEAL